MKFASCCLATFLVCLVSFHQSSSFKLHHGKPEQNEINELLPGRYFIQNVKTGLVIGAVNGQGSTGQYDMFGNSMESLADASRDPEKKAKVLWELERDSEIGQIGYTKFHSVGPYRNSNLEKEPFCLWDFCSTVDRNWVLVPREPGIWGIRRGHVLDYPAASLTCLTGFGLHQYIEENRFLCNVNDPWQSWRLIPDDSN